MQPCINVVGKFCFCCCYQTTAAKPAGLTMPLPLPLPLPLLQCLLLLLLLLHCCYCYYYCKCWFCFSVHISQFICTVFDLLSKCKQTACNFNGSNAPAPHTQLHAACLSLQPSVYSAHFTHRTTKRGVYIRGSSCTFYMNKNHLLILILHTYQLHAYLHRLQREAREFRYV